MKILISLCILLLLAGCGDYRQVEIAQGECDQDCSYFGRGAYYCKGFNGVCFQCDSDTTEVECQDWQEPYIPHFVKEGNEKD